MVIVENLACRFSVVWSALEVPGKIALNQNFRGARANVNLSGTREVGTSASFPKT